MLYDIEMLRCLSTHGVYPAFRFHVPECSVERTIQLFRRKGIIMTKTWFITGASKGFGREWAEETEAGLIFTTQATYPSRPSV